MSCERCGEWLNQVLDGEEPSPEYRAHLDTCRDCTELFEAAMSLRRGLSVMPLAEAPAGFTDRVVHSVVFDRQRRRTRGTWIAAAALAAAVLLAVFGLKFWTPEKPDERKVDEPSYAEWEPWLKQNGALLYQSVQRTTREVAENTRWVLRLVGGAQRNEPVSLRQSVVKAGSAVADLTTKQIDEAVESTLRLLPSFDPMLPATDVATPLETTARPLKEAGQNVGTGLEPLTGSARRAVALFVRDLTPGSGMVKPGS